MAKIGNPIALPSDMYGGPDAAMTYCFAQDAVYVWSGAGYVGVIGIDLAGAELIRNHRKNWPVAVIGIDTTPLSKGVIAYAEIRARWLELDAFTGRAVSAQGEIKTPSEFDGYMARAILYNTDRNEIDILVQPSLDGEPYGFVVLNSKTYEFDRFINLSSASVRGIPSTAPILTKKGKIFAGYGFGPETGEISSTLICIDADSDQIHSVFQMPDGPWESSFINGICVDNDREIIYVLSVGGEQSPESSIKTVVFVFDISGGIDLIAQSEELLGELGNPVFDHVNNLIYCCKNGLTSNIVTIDVNSLVIVNTIRLEDGAVEQICPLSRSDKIGVLLSKSVGMFDWQYTFVTIDQPSVPIEPEVGH